MLGARFVYVLEHSGVRVIVPFSLNFVTVIIGSILQVHYGSTNVRIGTALFGQRSQ